MLRSIVAAGMMTAVFFAGAARADMADEVKAKIQAHYTAIHAKDVEEVFGDHLDGFTIFPRRGGLLVKPGWRETRRRMGAPKPEFRPMSVTMRNFRTQIYDDVAVATFYLVGTYNEERVTNRVTAVWVKTDDGWKEAHHHESPLTP